MCQHTNSVGVSSRAGRKWEDGWPERLHGNVVSAESSGPVSVCVVTSTKLMNL